MFSLAGCRSETQKPHPPWQPVHSSHLEAWGNDEQIVSIGWRVMIDIAPARLKVFIRNLMSLRKYLIDLILW